MEDVGCIAVEFTEDEKTTESVITEMDETIQKERVNIVEN